MIEAFEFGRLNPQMLKDLEPIFAKHSDEWSAEDIEKLEFVILSARITIDSLRNRRSH